MTEYFGFTVDEQHEGEFLDLVENVDPKYWRAIAWGLSQLCQWYGDKAYRQLDEWFTVVYGTILMVEDSMQHTHEHDSIGINFDDIVVKPVWTKEFIDD